MSSNSRLGAVSHHDQIIVASGDVRVVRRALEDLRIPVGAEDEIKTFELVRLTLPRLDAEIAALRSNVALTRFASSVTDARRPRETQPAGDSVLPVPGPFTTVCVELPG